jgi:hypothetical protein
MPLTISSIIYFLMIHKLQLDYLTKATKQQPVRYGLFAKGLADCESHLARIELPAPPQRFSKLSKFLTAQVVPSVKAE